MEQTDSLDRSTIIKQALDKGQKPLMLHAGLSLFLCALPWVAPLRRPWLLRGIALLTPLLHGYALFKKEQVESADRLENKLKTMGWSERYLLGASFLAYNRSEDRLKEFNIPGLAKKEVDLKLLYKVELEDQSRNNSLGLLRNVHSLKVAYDLSGVPDSVNPGVLGAADYFLRNHKSKVEEASKELINNNNNPIWKRQNVLKEEYAEAGWNLLMNGFDSFSE